jgi:Flp pilus assembly protein TadG
MKTPYTRYLSDRRGNIAILGALTLPLFIGGIAFGTEASHWFVEKSKLSFATDAAAVSAGSLYNRGIANDHIESAIRETLVSEGYPDATLALGITYPTPISDLMTVTVSYETDKYFSQVLWDGNVSIASKTIVAIFGKPACILALNPTAANAVTMSGSSSATLDGCVVASNSNSASSIYLGGSTSLTVDCMVASGGIYGELNATTDCQSNRTFRRATRDPFASLVQPATPAFCTNPPNFQPSGTYTLSPGCFTQNLSLKGNVTFQPGVYILDGKNLKINSNAVVTGTNVTFVLKNGATLDFAGTATIKLTAPDAASGEPYPGILFWGAPDNNAAHKITGDSSSFFSGAMYLPDDAVQFTGNSGLNSDCARIIGDTVTLIGNADFNTNCTNFTGGYEISTADAVVIVE